MNDQYQEVGKLNIQHKDIYYKISKITHGKCTSEPSGNIKGKNGNLSFDHNQKEFRKHKCVKEMYNEQNRPIKLNFKAVYRKGVFKEIEKAIKINEKRKGNLSTWKSRGRECELDK